MGVRWCVPAYMSESVCLCECVWIRQEDGFQGQAVLRESGDESRERA